VPPREAIWIVAVKVIRKIAAERQQLKQDRRSHLRPNVDGVGKRLIQIGS
jgi:hypothetical protein